MKRGTPRHPKVASLADIISVELFAAVGLLELMWHFTSEYAPAGDIGRHSDQAIARALHWRKNAHTLVNGFVESRWLDKSDEYRLVVHDWPEHADDATHMKVARSRVRFWDGTIPNLKRLPSAERALAEQFYAHPVRTESASEALSGEGRVGIGSGKGRATEGKAAEKRLPAGYAMDEQFARFRAEYIAWGVNVIDPEDFIAAWPEWLVLDGLQREESINGVISRRESGADPNFGKTPRNFLKGREWKRAMRGSSADNLSAVARQAVRELKEEGSR